ncbi:hypothetical protein [Arsukibacterium sp.]|uniref:hypothetical protein n=1 Tax=Arsukibacterium sp. TaxID=1977258 RepID=UPI001BD46833|nr:hypothetical protein [Arsukibacterium sp.]
MQFTPKSSTKNHVRKQPGFWTYFAITMTIVGGMLAANVQADAADSFSVDSFQVEVIGSVKPVNMIPELMAQKCLEFNHHARHFIMLDQPAWLIARIDAALKD